MKIIGVTGTIGSGKSTLSKYLKESGYLIIDADTIAKQVLNENEEVKNEIVNEFGNIVLTEGKIDRNILRSIVFSKIESKEKLDKIVHKNIIQMINDKIEFYIKEGKKNIFLDAPLLFETNLDKKCDEVWVVFAKNKVKIERVMSRDNVTFENVENILKNQMDSREQIKRATYIIDNNHDKEHLYMQIDMIIEKSNIKPEPKYTKILKGKKVKIIK